MNIRQFELTVKKLEKKSYEVYYDFQKESDNHNNNRKDFYPLRMDKWYQTEKDIYRKYYENIKKVKKEIIYFKKELEEKKKMLDAAEALVKLSQTTKKRKLKIVEQQPTRKSKRLAEKKLNEVH
tara:strand:+ start:758 stop:1129 length:372 start_codon:yes stop_codon:yes gene_type:complete